MTEEENKNAVQNLAWKDVLTHGQPPIFRVETAGDGDVDDAA